MDRRNECRDRDRTGYTVRQSLLTDMHVKLTGDCDSDLPMVLVAVVGGEAEAGAYLTSKAAILFGISEPCPHAMFPMWLHILSRINPF